MPDGTINLLFSFIKHNDGHLPNCALSNKFKALKEAEVCYVEEAFSEASGN